MNVVTKVQRKLSKSLRVNGLWGTTKLTVLQPLMLWQNLRSNRRRNQTQAEFDRQYGTDTGGILSLSAFEVDSPNWIHGVRYAPTSPPRFRECLALTPMREADYESFTYIDLGFGKRRHPLIRVLSRVQEHNRRRVRTHAARRSRGEHPSVSEAWSKVNVRLL